MIDVMHNLFLKNMMSIWKDLNLLTKSNFKVLQQGIQDANVPVDIGRIPYKISSGMSGMTAKQQIGERTGHVFIPCTS